MAESDYCTLEDVKAQLDLDAGNTQHDAAILRAISAVSRHIDNYCWRRFHAQQETRCYTASFENWLDVDDLLSVSSIATDESGARSYPTRWSAEDYDLLPENASADGKPYTVIATREGGAHRFPVGIRGGVQIDGMFGYAAEIPAPITAACVLQSVRLFKRRDAIFGVAGSAEMGQQLVIARLDPDVRQLLDPYKRYC